MSDVSSPREAETRRGEPRAAGRFDRWLSHLRGPGHDGPDAAAASDDGAPARSGVSPRTAAADRMGGHAHVPTEPGGAHDETETMAREMSDEGDGTHRRRNRWSRLLGTEPETDSPAPRPETPESGSEQPNEQSKDPRPTHGPQDPRGGGVPSGDPLEALRRIWGEDLEVAPDLPLRSAAQADVPGGDARVLDQMSQTDDEAAAGPTTPQRRRTRHGRDRTEEERDRTERAAAQLRALATEEAATTETAETAEAAEQAPRETGQGAEDAEARLAAAEAARVAAEQAARAANDELTAEREARAAAEQATAERVEAERNARAASALAAAEKEAAEATIQEISARAEEYAAARDAAEAAVREATERAEAAQQAEAVARSELERERAARRTTEETMTTRSLSEHETFSRASQEAADQAVAERHAREAAEEELERVREEAARERAVQPATPEPASTEPVAPEPADTEPAAPEPADTEPAEPEPNTPDAAAPEPAAPEPAAPRSDAADRRADPEPVELRPRGTARLVAGVLEAVLLVATLYAAYRIYQEQTATSIVIAAVIGALYVAVHAVRASASSTRITIEQGRLHVQHDGSHHRFELSNPAVEVEQVGTPGRRGWRFLVHRRGMAPYRIDRSMVDPEEFMAAVRRYRPDL